MSMSFRAYGLRKAVDPKWIKYAAVWAACKKAGLGVPKEVGEYFSWDDPNALDGFQEVKIDDAVTEPRSQDSDVVEVDVTKLPKDVLAVRFEISY